MGANAGSLEDILIGACEIVVLIAALRIKKQSNQVGVGMEKNCWSQEEKGKVTKELLSIMGE